jgi:hypothetical protein
MQRTLFSTSESEGRFVRSSYKIYISPSKSIVHIKILYKKISRGVYRIPQAYRKNCEFRNC